ncbi:MAG: pilus assembly protein PilM [Planctomycetota bacterium]|nr:pilus assembly protein PilM [Planctomycetota bacterium]
MMYWRPRARSPIGIDVSGRYLHAVQLQRANGGWRLAAAGRYERANPESELSANEVRLFSELLERQGFTGRDVTLAVPGELLKSDLLELPAAASGLALEQLARMEMARTHKCLPDSFELTIWPLPSSGRSTDGQHVMAAACTHPESERLLEVWESGGLCVSALDVHASVVARVIQSRMTQQPHISAALDLTWDAARLVIFLENTVIYDRTLADGGLHLLNKTLVERLDVDSEVADFAIFQVGFGEILKAEWKNWPLLTDARGIMATHFTSMLDELRVSFSYAQHRYPDIPVDRLFLMGWGATVPGLAEPLESMLGIETQLITPSCTIDTPVDSRVALQDPGFTLATGLALFEESGC